MDIISLNNKKILIIDDEEDIVRLIRTVLKKKDSKIYIMLQT